jgi:uncharacterized protein (TIGR02145 family)
MKKLITLILGITLVYSCSTSSDGNGNTNSTVIPAAPSNLTGTVAPTTQINLSWTDNSTNETGFKIERRTGTGIYAIVGTVNSNILTFNDSGLLQNTTYIYRVYSYNTVGNSPTYSNELTITTSSSSLTMIDIDGNIYPLVTICNQVWTKTNLNVTKYRNGDVIPQITDANQWAALNTGAWCYYANTSSNGTSYGKLYNWYAVNDTRGLTPVGYHIPTDAEWSTMINCLDQNAIGGYNSNNNAGGAMKETGTTHWYTPNTGATNSSGFTGLPGPNRNTNGTFNAIAGSVGSWWSSSENGTISAWCRVLNFDSKSVYRGTNNKKVGVSVRCIRD